MRLTPEEKAAIAAALHLAEPLGALIPVPGNLIFLGILKAAEAELEADLDPETLDQLRAGVYDRLQARINARFAASTRLPTAPAAPLP